MNKFTTSLIAGFVAQAISGYASATTINEVEDNSTLSQAQTVTASDTNPLGINGVIGDIGGPMTSDVDFFEFYAQAGDVLTLDIDNGFFGAGQQSFDSVIAVYDENGVVQRINDDTDTVDPGSMTTMDARIDNFRAPATGRYTVGVATSGTYFITGGATSTASFGGDYLLNITGLQPAASQPAITYINIEVKPGQSGNDAPINPKSKGKIPVALLSSQSFQPMNVDTSTLRFGRTGTENSLSKCNKYGEDVNGDGFLDLICHFNNQAANFDYTSLEGIVTGQAKVDGQTISFEGRAPLKVAPHHKK